MSLIKCPECGKENVSDTAKVCPECGFAIEKHIRTEKKLKQKQNLKQKSKETLVKSVPFFKIIAMVTTAIIALYLIILLIVAISESLKPNEKYSTDELLHSYTYLSKQLGKMSYNDCKDYLKENGLKYQVIRNGNYGDIGTLQVYDDNGCVLEITTWDEPFNLVLVGYKDENNTFGIYAFNFKEDRIQYALQENDDKEIEVNSIERQLAWLKDKLALL